MKLWIFAFGKLKIPGLRESADYYQGLLRTWITMEEIELKPLPVHEKSPSARKLIQEKEGELLLTRISKQLSNRSLIYLLDEEGKSLTTQQWAQMVREWEASSTPDIALCIGSSLGFSSDVRKAARGSLSLGPQTLAHELARVILYEQTFRAWSVTRNHPYHNDGA